MPIRPRKRGSGHDRHRVRRSSSSWCCRERLPFWRMTSRVAGSNAIKHWPRRSDDDEGVTHIAVEQLAARRASCTAIAKLRLAKTGAGRSCGTACASCSPTNPLSPHEPPGPCWAPDGTRPQVACQLIRRIRYMAQSERRMELMPASDTQCFQVSWRHWPRSTQAAHPAAGGWYRQSSEKFDAIARRFACSM